MVDLAKHSEQRARGQPVSQNSHEDFLSLPLFADIPRLRCAVDEGRGHRDAGRNEAAGARGPCCGGD